MERRKFLLLGGAGVATTSVVGVAKFRSMGPFAHSPSVPDGMTVDAKSDFPRGPINVESASELDSLAPKVIASTVEADAELNDTDAVERFVAETDFSNSYIVAIMQFKGPGDNLRVEKIERKSAGLHVTLGIVDKNGEEAAVTAFILLRISDAKAGVPETVTTESKTIDPLF